MPEPISPDQSRINQSSHLRKMPGFKQARSILKDVKPHIDEAVESGIRENPDIDRKGIQNLRRAAFRSAAGLHNESKELVEEARIDPLTGTLSRSEFMRKVAEEAVRMKRHGKKSTLIFWDLNDLKIINDSLGHAAGDKRLVSFTTIVRESSRETDSLGRFGGDEFVSLLPEAGADGAMIHWNRVNSILQEKEISVSAGIAEIDPNDPEFSIAKADEAMYEAKRASKIARVNTIVIHQESKP